MKVDPTAARDAAEAVPGVPRDQEGPVFREPWEAQAFALALVLHQQGLYTWREWAATLAEEIRRARLAGDPDTGETYYRHWLATLESLVASKGIASAETQTRYREAWHHAEHRTSHGTPIELSHGDFTGTEDS
ncbi:nitrile hydratase accessory protein [Polaromonas sp. UC242_47]|uniref:nitrile hydratase accessory protein n=1 Tax=Polaromonas sp. UC242_47 TaxID=3374626 RepID=UPI00379870A4